eukprot:1861571-Rhodomonas_salina.1
MTILTVVTIERLSLHHSGPIGTAGGPGPGPPAGTPGQTVNLGIPTDESQAREPDSPGVGTPLPGP